MTEKLYNRQRQGIAQIHNAIKAHYLKQGRAVAQWEIVSQDPQKFNAVWRHSLRLPHDTKPPPVSMQNICPETGQRLY